MQNSGRVWAVRLDAGMYAEGWGGREQPQRGGVHFVGDGGDWCRVNTAPRLMTQRNAKRCIAVLERIGCRGAVVLAGAAT